MFNPKQHFTQNHGLHSAPRWASKVKSVSQEQPQSLINIFLNSSLDFGFSSSPSLVFGLFARGLTLLGKNVFLPFSSMLSWCRGAVKCTELAVPGSSGILDVLVDTFASEFPALLASLLSPAASF